jgi:hypothetical protein
MSKENLTMFEQVIDSEKGEEREFYLKGLKDTIGKLEKDADEDLKKEISRLKTKFSLGGAKKTPAPKKTPAKKTTAKRTTKPKTTKEEREKKKAEVKDATGKTIEECKEILAKYEAMRLKTNKEQKERVSELKKKDEIIEGTNVKTADATTKTTAKEVAPKIKKEVEQIEKEAEIEAKKVVKPQGKTATEVKKQVEKKKDELIEKKVEDMTKDLASASANFVKSVQSEIAKFSKDDAKKFLIDLRKQIDTLLRAYGYGGELSAGVQAYEIPWAGGGRPTMYAKGGNILGALSQDWGRDSDVYLAVHDSYVAYDSDEKAKEVLEEYDMLEDYEHLFAKGGKTRSTWSIKQDRRFLSKEPWEQAYKPKRKGNYFSKGGYVDLFEEYEQQPPKVRAIYDKYEEKIIDGDFDYSDSADFLKEMQSIGYTFDYGLDNVPYGLRPIGVDLNELEGYEEYAKGGFVYDSFEVENQNGSFRYELEMFKNADGKPFYQVSAYRDGSDVPNIIGNFYDENESIKYFNQFRNKFAKGGSTYQGGGEVENSFSRKAEARGLDTEDFMNQVLHNPSYYDERTRRQAQFMNNESNM